MIRVNWDVEELVALVDVYRRSSGKSNIQINEELLTLSKELTKRADQLGIVHDEKYRNLNGMKMMFQNVVYAATDGQQGLSSASAALQKVYRMSCKEPEIFNLILDEFHRRYGIGK